MMNNKTMGSLTSTFANLLIAGLLMCFSINAVAANPKIRIILAKSEVSALDSAGATRKLKRGSTIVPGDTVQTAAGAKAVIRFPDGETVSLDASSALQITAYQYTEGGVANTSKKNLVNGAFRAVSGLIGKQPGDNYQVDSAYGSIGIRGTDWAASIVNRALSLGVNNGRIFFKNDAGSIDLSPDSQFAFTRVTSRTQRPVGLRQPPAALQNILRLRINVPDVDAAVAATTGGDDEDGEDDDDSGDDKGDDDSGDGKGDDDSGDGKGDDDSGDGKGGDESGDGKGGDDSGDGKGGDESGDGKGGPGGDDSGDGKGGEGSGGPGGDGKDSGGGDGASFGGDGGGDGDTDLGLSIGQRCL